MKTPVMFLAFSLAATTLTACDPAGPDEALIGSWTRMRDGTTEVKDHFSFAADGKMTFDENKPDDRTSEDHMTGTYVVADGVVTATASNTRDGGRSRLTFTYYANETVFAPQAFRAAGGHDGAVGVWNAMIKVEDLDSPTEAPEGLSFMLDVHADKTLQMNRTFTDNYTQSWQGTWVLDPDRTFRASLVVNGTPSESTFKLLDGEALVSPTYIWQRD